MLPFTVFIGHLISTKECILIFLHKLSNIKCPAYLDVKTNIRKERVTFRGQMPFENLESSRMTQSFDLRFALRKEYTLNFSSFSHLIHINLSHS